ncbi:Similar to PSMB2: Proteasome subunit beta type-2 (Bos taurus) [Cotesia congregata]|uniref:Proteasome subunit beta n=1 Tax=Cotesia congregata TaxID=51543 RepID=A0A8J2MV78_COTCN|nr:Similar to PSMB2: Proteasome subunit beta type-2 (Bos taurus) [Cotesia congregata]
MTECSIGVRFDDFVLIAADSTTAQSIMVMKNDENKIYKISDKLVMAVIGEQGDSTQFSEYIGKNIQLYKMRNGYELSPKAAATFTRRKLADYLRSRTPYFVNLLMAGYDSETGPELYFIDYLASCVKAPFACHGYDMNEHEAYDLLKKCVTEVHKRLIVNLPNFKVQKITKEGVIDLPSITAQNLAVEAAARG